MDLINNQLLVTTFRHATQSRIFDFPNLFKTIRLLIFNKINININNNNISLSPSRISWGVGARKKTSNASETRKLNSFENLKWS